MRMNPVVQGAAVVAALVTAVGLTAAPASAESQSHRDPRGDVEQLPARAAAKPKPGIDVVSLRNTYEGGTLTMSMTTAKLLKKGYGAEWLIQTTDGAYVLIFDHTTADTQVQFIEVGGVPRRPLTLGRGQSDCSGAKAKAKGDTVIATVPRNCIGGASEVRIGGATIEPLDGGGLKADDSRRKGLDADSIKLGPSLSRN